MLITCPSCEKDYTIDAGRVGATGRTVRCAACRSTWFVAGAIAPEGELAPEGEAAEPASPFNGPEPAVDWTSGASPGAKGAIAAEAHTARSSAEPAPRRARRLGRTIRTAKPQRPATRSASMPALLTMAGLAAVALTAIFARDRIVGLWPETAILYAAAGAPVNLRGLALKGVSSALQRKDDEVLLVVDGEIANETSRELEVPRLALAIRGTDGQALYTWTNEPPRGTLGPGETARFRAKLASPPAEGRQVLVRFATAGDGTPVAAKGQ